MKSSNGASMIRYRFVKHEDHHTYQWVNDKYREIKFPLSTKNDRILIAEKGYSSEDERDGDGDNNDNKIGMIKVGIGRLIHLTPTTTSNDDNDSHDDDDTETDIVEDHWELGGIYVEESARRQGVARELVTRLIQEMKSKIQCNTKTTILWCIPFQHLQDFYISCGFQPVLPSLDDTDNVQRRQRLLLPKPLQCKLCKCSSAFPDVPTTVLKMNLLKK